MGRTVSEKEYASLHATISLLPGTKANLADDGPRRMVRVSAFK